MQSWQLQMELACFAVQLAEEYHHFPNVVIKG
jgi:hypothetical protein